MGRRRNVRSVKDAKQLISQGSRIRLDENRGDKHISIASAEAAVFFNYAGNIVGDISCITKSSIVENQIGAVDFLIS